ncbi:sulfatase-like hydrolase/transferase [Rhodopirellula sallentina]|uniref:sulfatase-like hydrolase/transferase n=1 Tax=Rhodopirellula sallentina TaxID=1263869 RepID=UPI001F0067E5|nr:sulfatase-like hydrolase/transferase [Rhodopirellula sallentina]
MFVFTDDLGWGDLGVFYQNESKNDKKHRTPHLDRLAGGGLQMRAHYCPAPVCAPSRSSLLTGVHQGNAVIRNNQFDKGLEDNHTLGSVLREAGYRTCMIGKYGLQGGPKGKQQTGTPSDWPSYPTKRGFDEFFGYVSHYAGHLHYPNDPWKLANKGHQGVPNLWHSDESGDYEISESLSKCYTTDLFTARAKHFLKTHVQSNGDQPFFLMLNYDTPHAALQIPTIPYPSGGGVGGGLQWTGGTKPDAISQPAINTATGEVDSFIHPDYAAEDWSDVEKRFATMVRRIDNAVGDLNETLEDLGLAEDTLVIFTSDNGPHHEAYFKGESWGASSYSPQAFQSYGPYDGTKRDCWEGGIRMPTLAWWKGTVAANRIDSTPSQFHDWMATLCDVAGVPAPARCDGVSLLPTLTGEGEQAESLVYIEYQNGSKTADYKDFLASRRDRPRKEMQVIRMDGSDGKSYKGVRYNIKSADDDFEIYDVESDVDEASNLAGTSEAVKQLQSRMKAKVLQVHSPNESAIRPYDKAAIPASEQAPAGYQVHRFALPGNVSYVPTATGESDPVSSDVIEDAQGKQTFTAPGPGIYEIRGAMALDEVGTYAIHVESESACFMRLHESHAIDLQESGQATSAKRILAAGKHPIVLTIRVEKQGAKTTWTINHP